MTTQTTHFIYIWHLRSLQKCKESYRERDVKIRRIVSKTGGRQLEIPIRLSRLKSFAMQSGQILIEKSGKNTILRSL